MNEIEKLKAYIEELKSLLEEVCEELDEDHVHDREICDGCIYNNFV